MEATLDFFLDIIEDAVIYGNAKMNVLDFLEDVKVKKIPFIKSNDVRQSACYMYALWLKRGFHLKQHGTKYQVLITPKNKKENFDQFRKYIYEYAEKIVSLNPVRDVYITLKSINSKSINEIYLVEIIEAFMHLYYAWFRIMTRIEK